MNLKGFTKRLPEWTPSGLIVGVCLLLAFFTRGGKVEEYLEQNIAHPLAFNIREDMGLTPELSRRLKFFALDDKAFSYLNFSIPSTDLWIKLLGSMAKARPAVIIIDSAMVQEPGSTPEFMVDLEQLLASKVPVASLALFPTANLGLSSLPDSYLLSIDVPEAQVDMALPPVGAAKQILPAVSFIGHFDYVDPYRFRPLLITDNGHGFQGVAHLASFAARSRFVQNGKLSIDGRVVPVDSQGLAFADLLPRGSFHERIYSLKQAFQSARKGDVNPYVNPGDIVVILTRHMTGRNDVLSGPFGPLLYTHLAASIYNGFVRGEWLYPVQNGTLICIFTILLGAALGRRGGALGFWLAGSGVTVAFAAGCLVLFCSHGLVIPWILPCTFLWISGLGVYAHQRWNDAKERVEYTNKLKAAATIQRHYLPPLDYSDSCLEVAVYYRPAEGLGGDWYSYYQYRQGWFHVHLGDVTGHGIDSALLSTFAKGASDMAYSLAVENRDENVELPKLHTSLNRMLSEPGGQEGIQMALMSLALNPLTGEACLLNSGLPVPLYANPEERSARPLVTSPPNSVLGIDFRKSAPKSRTFSVMAGQCMLIYSDGLLDVPRRFGYRCSVKSLAKLLHEQRDMSAGEIRAVIAERLGVDVVRRESACDDVTYIVIRIKQVTSGDKNPTAEEVPKEGAKAV